MIKLSNSLIFITDIKVRSTLLILLIAIAALSNYHKTIDLFWLSSTIRHFIFTFIGLVGFLLFVTKQISIRSIGSIDIAIILFLIYSAGNNIIKSLPNLPSEDIYLSFFFLLYYLSLRFSPTSQIEPLYRSILSGLVVLCTLQALLGTLQKFSLIEPFSETFKVSGTFINPGIYGCFLVLGLLITINQLTSDIKNPISKMIYVAISILIFVALLYSGSRTSWLALLGGLSCIALFKIDAIGLLKKQNRIKILVAGMALAIGIYLLISMNTLSIDGRLLIWKISIPMAIQNPFTGLGYGSFFIEYGNYQAEYFSDAKVPQNEIQLASMNYYIFNEYYKVIIEEGIIGFVLFFIIQVCLIRSLAQKLLHSKKQDSFLLLTSASMGTALAIFGIFSYPSQDLAINMILLSFVAWIGHGQAESQKSMHINLGIGKKIGYLIMSLCISTIFASGIKIWAILRWKTAHENILVQEGFSLRTYAEIRPLLANDGTFLYNYGAELHDLGMAKEARKILKCATLYGNSVELQLKLAENAINLGDLAAAEQYYIKATYMNPKLFVPFDSLFNFYINTGQNVKARAIANRICKKKIKIGSEKVYKIRDRACKYIQEYETQ